MADNGRNVEPVGRVLEAVQFAATKHKDQRRKDPEKTPYINHPIGVAYILWKEGGVYDTDVLQVRVKSHGPFCAKYSDTKHKRMV